MAELKHRWRIMMNNEMLGRRVKFRFIEFITHPMTNKQASQLGAKLAKEYKSDQYYLSRAD